MKRLLLLITILTCSICSATTIEEATAWIAPDALTTDDVRFIKILDCKIGRNQTHILNATGYLHIQTAYLDQEVSKEMQEYRWNQTESGPVLLKDFLLLPPVDLGDGTSIICLCSHDFNGSRKSYTSSWFISMWMIGVAPFGYTDEDILDQAEMEALLPVESE